MYKRQPLYYLLLNFWTRVFGTADLTLRLFSMVWTVASFPVLCLVAHRLGGRRAVLPAAALLGAAPLTLHYATEGRMYSMLWFLAVVLAALTIELQRQGRRNVFVLLWIFVGTAGFLTHYFFAFVWVVCAVWLFLRPGLLARSQVLASAVATGLLILPWYAMVPGILGRWRITGDWLYKPLARSEAVLAPFELAWNFVSGPRWSGPEMGDWAAGLMIGLIAFAGWRHSPSTLFSERRALIWLWLVAACLGPVAFDLLNGTGTARYPRYALGGSPAAILLLAYGVSLLSSKLRTVTVLALVLAWSQGVFALFSVSDRQGQSFKRIAASISSSIGASDVVLVHSIPSGVLALARYLDPNVQVASWVGQLGQRHVPEDVWELTRGATGVVLVKIHDVGEPAPEEDWLREHAVVVKQTRQKNGRIVTFAPRGFEKFAWTRSESEEAVSLIR